MRVSTAYLFEQNLSAMLSQQTALGKTQLQISTGKRILSPSDDPAGSVQVLSLQREVSVSEQYLVNTDKAENKLSIEEGVLSGATTMLQRIRELAVQGFTWKFLKSWQQMRRINIADLNSRPLIDKINATKELIKQAKKFYVSLLSDATPQQRRILENNFDMLLKQSPEILKNQRKITSKKSDNLVRF